MRVLIACECSGRIRDQFRQRGHAAWSCDLKADPSPFHHQCDVLELLQREPYDLMICHPPCQFLCSSGLHWNRRRPGRIHQTEQAIAFALALWNSPVERVSLENPIGCLSKAIRKPDQIIQPYEFGEDASKATCLWLRGLPLLKPTEFVPGRLVVHSGRQVYRWSNQTDSGQNRLGPSAERSAIRAETYPGIAAAMAQQWGYSNGGGPRPAR